MTESDLATVGIWSYGLAAVGFLAFAVRLMLGWRPGIRAALLLAATVVTALWAVAGAAVAYRPGYELWLGSTVADTLRYAVWFLFLGSLLHGMHGATQARPGRRRMPRWVTVLVAIALVACVLVPYAPPCDDHRGAARRA